MELAEWTRTIASNFDDDLPRLMFADSLDDNGHATWASFVRNNIWAKGEPNEDEYQAQMAHRSNPVAPFTVEAAEYHRGFALELRPGLDFVNGLSATEVDIHLAGTRRLDLSFRERGFTTMVLDNMRDNPERYQTITDLILTRSDVAEGSLSGAIESLPNLKRVYLFQSSLCDRPNAVLSSGSRSVDLLFEYIDSDGCTYEKELHAYRRLVIRRDILPVLKTIFFRCPKIKAIKMLVGQYWDDEADDAVHVRFIPADHLDPDWEGLSDYGDDENEDDNSFRKMNLSTLTDKEKKLFKYDSATFSEYGPFPGTDIRWGDNYTAISLWSSFAPTDGSQHHEGYSAYAPAITFYRHGGYIWHNPIRSDEDEVSLPEWDRNNGEARSVYFDNVVSDGNDE